MLSLLIVGGFFFGRASDQVPFVTRSLFSEGRRKLNLLKLTVHWDQVGPQVTSLTAPFNPMNWLLSNVRKEYNEDKLFTFILIPLMVAFFMASRIEGLSHKTKLTIMSSGWMRMITSKSMQFRTEE